MSTVNITNIPGGVYKTKVDNFLNIKHAILDEIEKKGIYGMKDSCQQIYNSNFHLHELYNSKLESLRDIILPSINKHNKLVAQKLGYLDMHLINYWYQQYQRNDFHKWHIHTHCVFSNVFYINLGDNNSGTSFKYLDQEFKIDVTEGEILTFPSHLLHCSHPNKTDIMKTVIAFNTDPIQIP